MENSDVKQKLIEAGKKEFLRCGYDKASMRHISTIANVSTGAIYFFFCNKEEFFRNILDDTAIALKRMIREYTESEVTGKKSSVSNDKELIRFLFEHKDETRILLERAKGTIYETYADEIYEMLEDAFMVFYRRMGGEERHSSMIKLVVRMRIQGYVEMLNGDYTMEQAIQYSELLACYADSGFEGMMKQYNSIFKGSVK